MTKHKPKTKAITRLETKQIEAKEPEFSIELITHPLKRLFIETFYATDGNVTKTTKAVGIHRRSYYEWIETDPCFKYLIQEQKQQLLDEIDAICRGQAKETKSVTERIFWLKTHHPEYKQNDTLAFRDAAGNQFVMSRGSR